jgi:hypothetical protein
MTVRELVDALLDRDQKEEVFVMVGDELMSVREVETRWLLPDQPVQAYEPVLVLQED